MNTSLKPLPFQVGEELIFSLRWMGIPVGTATLAVPETLRYRGHSVLHFVAMIRARFLVSLFQPIRIDVYADPEGWFSRWYRFSQREAGKARETEIVFDPEQGVATYRVDDRAPKTSSLKPGALDPFSPLYYFRCQKIGVETSVFMDVFDGKKNRQLEVKVLRTERIPTLWGETETFVVQPELREGSISVLPEDTVAWFTRDGGRVPVKVQIKTSIGCIVATLTGAEGV